jgi:stage IV sporulation protein FB
MFVFLGASQEAFLHRQRAMVLGRRARDAMVTEFETLAPQDTLDSAAQRLLATHQQDFPVVDLWERVAGVLPRARLLQGLAQLGGDAAVLEVMEREVARVEPETSLDQVLRLLRSRPQCPVIVVAEDRPVGMITLENITEFIEVARSAGSSGEIAVDGSQSR